MDLKQTLQTLLSEGKIGKAIEQFSAWAAENDRELNNQVILLNARFTNLRKNERMNLLSPDDLDIQRNRIVHALLSLVDDIQHIDSRPRITNPADSNPVDLIPPSPIVKPEKTKILFFGANPTDTVRLRLEREYGAIEDELAMSQQRELFEFKVSNRGRVEDLRKEVLRYRPHIIHFSGHGEDHGIKLVNDTHAGETVIVDNEALAGFFKLFAKYIRCVVLNSCYSESQCKLIAAALPEAVHIIGMKDAVADKSAIAFAAAFYQALGNGEEIPFAFDWAKNAIAMHGLPNSDMPVLI